MFFRSHGHDVNPADQGGDRLDRFGGDPDSLLDPFLPGTGLEAGDQGGRNPDSGNLFVQIAGHGGRFQQDDSADDRNAEGTGKLHEAIQPVRVEDHLCLKEAGSGIELFLEPFFLRGQSPSGEVAAPGRRSVGPFRSFPARSLPPFKSVIARISSGEVRSKTGLVSG